jgi:hypothetical protein
VLDKTLYRSNMSPYDCQVFTYLKKMLKSHISILLPRTIPRLVPFEKPTLIPHERAYVYLRAQGNRPESFLFPSYLCYTLFLLYSVCSKHEKVLWSWKVLISRFWQITHFEVPPELWKTCFWNAFCLSVMSVPYEYEHCSSKNRSLQMATENWMVIFSKLLQWFWLHLLRPCP